MKKLVLVECITQHRVRYVVEVEDDIAHALDEVVWQEGNPDFHEFSQEWLGQTTVSHREISKAEYLKIFDEDNDYLKSWANDQKFRFINKIKYEEEKNDNTDSGNEA